MDNRPILRNWECFVCRGTDKPLFRFPKNSEKLKLWLDAIGKSSLLSQLTEVYITNNGRICAKHFEDWAFSSTLRNNLILHAVPCSSSPLPDTVVARAKYCDVESCDTVTRSPEGIRLFPVPNDYMAAKWSQFIRFKPTHRIIKHVCAKHFENSAFKDASKHLLHRYAIPTIQSWDEPVIIKQECVEIDNSESDDVSEISLSTESSTKHPYILKLSKVQLNTNNCTTSDHTEMLSKNFEKDCCDENKFNGRQLKEDAMPTTVNPSECGTNEKYIIKLPLEKTCNNITLAFVREDDSAPQEEEKDCFSDFNESDLECPEKVKQIFEMAKNQIMNYKRKIKNLTASNKRLNKRVAFLSNALNEEKKKRLNELFPTMEHTTLDLT